MLVVLQIFGDILVTLCCHMQILCDPTDIVRSCRSCVILPIVCDPANLLVINPAHALNILQICLWSCQYVGGPADLLVVLSCRSFDGPADELVVLPICLFSCRYVGDPADMLVIVQICLWSCRSVGGPAKLW